LKSTVVNWGCTIQAPKPLTYNDQPTDPTTHTLIYTNIYTYSFLFVCHWKGKQCF